MLAFLFCDSPSIVDGKTRLDGIFDAIQVSPARTRIMPRFGRPADPTEFFVFYKAVVTQPCKLSLRVFGPQGNEISGIWNDDIGQTGLVQSVWAIATTFLLETGTYRFELWQNFSERLVTADLVVAHTVQ